MYVGGNLMTVAEIAHHLKGRKSGRGYVARCPAHDDQNPSLSLCVVDGMLFPCTVMPAASSATSSLH